MVGKREMDGERNEGRVEGGNREREREEREKYIVARMSAFYL